MTFIEVYGGERSVAFGLTTTVCALGAIANVDDDVKQSFILVNFESEAEFVCTVF